MTQDVLPDQVHREYRELPDREFEVDSIIRGGRTRRRRRRAVQASGAVAAVAAGFLVLGPGVALLDRASTTTLPSGPSPSPHVATVSVGCLAPQWIGDCEERILAWASTSAGQWNFRQSGFGANPAYGAAGRSFELTRQRPGASDISEHLEITVVTEGIDLAAQLPNLAFTPDPAALSDGSQSWVSPMAAATHIDGTILQGVDGQRASVVILLKADDTSVGKLEPGVAPLPMGWSKDRRSLLEALIRGR